MGWLRRLFRPRYEVVPWNINTGENLDNAVRIWTFRSERAAHNQAHSLNMYAGIRQSNVRYRVQEIR